VCLLAPRDVEPARPAPCLFRGSNDCRPTSRACPTYLPADCPTSRHTCAQGNAGRANAWAPRQQPQDQTHSMLILVQAVETSGAMPIALPRLVMAFTVLFRNPIQPFGRPESGYQAGDFVSATLSSVLCRTTDHGGPHPPPHDRFHPTVPRPPCLMG